MKTRVRIRLYGLAALIIFGAYATTAGLEHYSIAKLEPAPLSNMTLIAHAGGGLDQGMKSNAKEAFEQSAKRGYIYIEADFSETQSGELVLIHNWDEAWYNWYSKAPFVPNLWAKFRPKRANTAKEFLSVNMRHDLTQMSADQLMVWLGQNPNIRLVTDIKNNSVQNLNRLRDNYPVISKQLIPQIYYPTEYAPVKAMGYDDIIFTAYRSKLPDNEIIDFMDHNALFALTAPVETVTDDLINAATSRNIPVWVHRGKHTSPHGVMNTPEFAARWKARGISGLYTDYLYPADK